MIYILLISILTLILFVAFESNLFTRIKQKIRPQGSSPIVSKDCDTLTHCLSNVSAQFLSKKDLKLALTTDMHVTRLEKLTRFNEHNPNDWSYTMLLLGILECEDGYSKYQRQIEKFTDTIINDRGHFKRELRHVNHSMIGTAFAQMFHISGDLKYRVACDGIYGFLMNDHPRSNNGLIPYMPNSKNYMFVDTIGMICPFLTRYGIDRNAKEAIDLSLKQLDEFYEFGFDGNSDLPYHAYDPQKGGQFGIIGWLRGIGWLLWGTIDTLKYLDTTSSEHEILSSRFQKLLIAIEQHFTANRRFSWDLLNPYSHEDTSGATMIGYAIERAIELNIATEDNINMSDSIYEFLRQNVNYRGEVENGLAECQGVGHYPNYFGKTSYAQGSALAYSALYSKRKC